MASSRALDLFVLVNDQYRRVARDGLCVRVCFAKGYPDYGIAHTYYDAKERENGQLVLPSYSVRSDLVGRVLSTRDPRSRRSRSQSVRRGSVRTLAFAPLTSGMAHAHAAAAASTRFTSACATTATHCL